LLHQTWKTRSLPPRFEQYHASWQKFNPDLKQHFYDDATSRDLVRTKFPEYLDVYDDYTFGVQRADLFRFLVVYEYGGLYADVDMECLRNLDCFFSLDGATFCVEGYLTETRKTQLGYRHPIQVANCVFMAEPRHPFIRRVIDTIISLSRMRRAFSTADVESITGPPVLTRLVAEHQTVRLLDQIYWMPPTAYPNLRPLSANMYMRHHFAGSWKTAQKQTMGQSLRRHWVERWRLPHPFPKKPFLDLGSLDKRGKA
jgi:mannosyltransferase OCH1-like enzyme